MTFDRYSRGLIPSQTESVPDFVNTELLKVERTFDSLYAFATTSLTASEIHNVPAGAILATDVQAALNGLDTELTALTGTVTALDAAKANLAGATFTGPVIVPSPFTVGSSQVLTTRQTGWTADTGTAKRTANATYSGTADVAYTQATIQTLMDALRDVSQALKALKDDLITHGIIGP